MKPSFDVYVHAASERDPGLLIASERDPGLLIGAF
jgi:hypothetical protein